MIWMLIVVTLAGDVAMQPFATQAECKAVQERVVWAGGRSNYSSVIDSVCLHVKNPYK